MNIIIRITRGVAISAVTYTACALCIGVQVAMALSVVVSFMVTLLWSDIDDPEAYERDAKRDGL